VQVVSNLLNNAVKFTRDGTVCVKAEQNADQVIVSIKDTGQGIDPEILPRLFSKFATKSFSGTGLGLFISKSIIESHGGKIWAENNSIDGKRGATFYFSLPIVDHRFSVFQLSD
jgi:signal transduction histidine kinase